MRRAAAKIFGRDTVGNEGEKGDRGLHKAGETMEILLLKWSDLHFMREGRLMICPKDKMAEKRMT
jgi:hypothetical protein